MNYVSRGWYIEEPVTPESVSHKIDRRGWFDTPARYESICGFISKSGVDIFKHTLASDPRYTHCSVCSRIMIMCELAE